MIISTYISPAERGRLLQSDHEYLKKKLEGECLLNRIMHRPVNERLLNELQCLLDRKPIPRRKTEHKNGKVTYRKVSEEEFNKLWK